MRFRRLSRTTIVAALFLLVSLTWASAQQPAAAPTQPGLLTVDLIYGQPSLSGRLTRGIAWSTEGEKLSYF